MQDQQPSTREQMIEKALGPLMKEQSGGLCVPGVRCFTCDCGGSVEGYARSHVEIVLDAVLPQVSTLDQLRALPAVAVVVTPGGAARTVMQLLQALDMGLSWPTNHFPLAVVWTPPIT